MRMLTWPAVALATIGVGGFVSLYYIADQNGRTALIAVVTGMGTAITTLLINKRFAEVKQDMQQIKEHVNGSTRALIDKIPDADRPLEADVPQMS